MKPFTFQKVVKKQHFSSVKIDVLESLAPPNKKPETFKQLIHWEILKIAQNSADFWFVS
jgi:hypothetical protein